MPSFKVEKFKIAIPMKSIKEGFISSYASFATEAFFTIK